ncbi:helix-turn-helix domain-containing protein [Anaeroselena agilis]|uniref:Helix-turn-helix domain-containing protein n=1 Tax=Anaeroselena agilis TaxID=3063788 RepID=A0ABU3NYF8_9FIRM|nr:helix-turn-helix domain-containing protein [Selenomonadales bacterium 4137-cl]
MIVDNLAEVRRLTYTVTELTQVLGVSYPTARKQVLEWKKTKKVPVRKVGREWRIPKESVHAWLRGTG